MFRSRRPDRGEAWEGVVVGKSRGMTDGAYMYHYVEVKLSTGETEKVRIGRRLWKSLATGDSLVKPAGADLAEQ